MNTLQADYNEAINSLHNLLEACSEAAVELENLAGKDSIVLYRLRKAMHEVLSTKPYPPYEGGK